jgi:hypothetical protein
MDFAERRRAQLRLAGALAATEGPQAEEENLVNAE